MGRISSVIETYLKCQKKIQVGVHLDPYIKCPLKRSKLIKT